ncbi:pullulanase [Mycobacterium sp. TNTM28]|uniref:Pullulanase n=1 Tax=[Mycobacterium] fortunisiensis TaxID=2600579 RepID=A0ABS6KHJ5_9MYCO|nr:pullulanase [[Mycobacterium] fortunisiensis]MBU9763010.1 pullulanase [[Mycobacterium] fortunisiensis]
MDYCLGDSDGAVTIHTGVPDVDVDGDGSPDGVGLDFDGDGRIDDVLADFDGDGLAERMVLDVDDDGRAESYYSDDGSGTWAVRVDRSGQVRWFGLDGMEQTGGPLVDFDADGAADDRLVDVDGDGLADRVLAGELAYVDTDGDGQWDMKLADTDGDGRADSVS